jgi:metallophosphoesterase superfamily enzyme
MDSNKRLEELPSANSKRRKEYMIYHGHKPVNKEKNIQITP